MVSESIPKEIRDKFVRILPIAWQQLFFTGRYNFKKASKNAIDISALADLLEQHLRQVFWKL
ncbi:hypothetical protein [Xenorhabdus bovienii]|uniref:hypothetical protein n=1 Tax=Xenorhabdus bovienii TaxID=40576 RepID=UPI00237CCA4B|nr:hypothetical protein [Xenorhabdus bovienii]MDE1475923.1 hypothetical protein [Xenorhabdus bovienii]MDE9483912.1 hypothetical protein [Xenorhabdus bovienii]MDE9545665.1 hypothetical protein [Xenorhabdus bovienii]